MSLLRRFMLGLACGLTAWAATAFVLGLGPWSPVIGLAAALVLWA
ncbi:hypothetical protein [Streptomyces sp. NBC_00519]